MVGVHYDSLQTLDNSIVPVIVIFNLVQFLRKL